MLRIGITGGIGSGKSTVCRIFEVLGIPVYYADERARAIMVEQAELRRGIEALFGADAYLQDGSLNRPYIAQRAFSDQQLLQKLNALVHPAVWKDGAAWEEQHRNTPYTLKEAALLYESGGNQLLDYIIVVEAPDELRIKRVMERDQVDRSAVQARMDKQWPQADKVAKADFVIHNDGQHSLIKQVLTIHRTLLQYAQEKK